MTTSTIATRKNTLTLRTSAKDGGSFNCRPYAEHEVNPDCILCNNIVFPGEFNPHNTRLWIIGHEFGAFGAVWADCEQDALDELVDAGLGDGLLVDDPDPDDDDLAHLGNAGEAADLTNVWMAPVLLNPEKDFALMLRLAEARGANQTTLEN